MTLEAPQVDAVRVIADLRLLALRTGDEAGAQRLCWTETWRDARAFLRAQLDSVGAACEVDEAGNLWARIEGEDPTADALVVGSHIDSVPDGGWLDGALGIMAAVGVLRAWAESARKPPRPIVLVDWADEEGARFGISLFGSSAFADSLDARAAAKLRDADGLDMKSVLAENGVEILKAADCSKRREGLSAYLELHIEQGPVLEAKGATLAAVEGCQGIERHRFTFTGQASHAGTTPMDMRRDAGLAAADCALRMAELPAEHGGVATTGDLRLEPGIITAVAGVSHLGCDLRNPDPGALASMLTAARKAARESAKRYGCGFTEAPIFRIEPIAFDGDLVGMADSVCEGATGKGFRLTSGALHDAAEVARVMPAAMLFCPSKGGISHAMEEDTADEDLEAAIAAYGELASAVLAR